MGLTQCIDLTKQCRGIAIENIGTYFYDSRYECAHLLWGNGISFSFELREKQAVQMKLFVCDVLEGDLLDTTFEVTVNGTKVLEAFQEHNWGFHEVLCKIPESVAREGTNNVEISLSVQSVTSLFVKSISLTTLGAGRSDSVSLSFRAYCPKVEYELQECFCEYRAQYNSWVLAVNGSYMEFDFDLDTVRELVLTLDLCSGLVGTIMNCPIRITVNGKELIKDFDKKNFGFCEYSFTVAADYLAHGENVVRIELQQNATTCMYIRYIKLREGEKSIQFITTNDVHGRFLGEGIDFAKLAAYKTEMQAAGKDCLLIDAGDPTQGTPFAIFDKGASVIELMNKVGYDLLTIGNHEFDNISKDPGSKDELAENIRAFAGDFISCNVNYEGKNYIQSILPHKNGGWCIRNINGINILFVGFTTPDISTNIPRMEGFQIDDIQTAGCNAMKLVDKLRENTPISVVVAISHLGSKKKEKNYQALADNFPAVDIILDGHSHEIYTCDVPVVYGGKNKVVKVIQADCYAQCYGMVKLQFQYDELTEISMQVEKCATLNAMNFDKNAKYLSMKDYIECKKQELDTTFGRVRCTQLNHTLWGGALNEEKPYPALKAVNIARYVQTNMGVLTAEAMVWDACQQLNKNSDMYIIGGINGGGIRDSICCNKAVKDYDLFSVLPSQLKSKVNAGYRVIEITLEVLKKVLENSVSAISVDQRDGKDVLVAGSGCFLNTFGIKFTIYKENGKLVIGNEIKLTKQVSGDAVERTLQFSKHGNEKILICMEKYISSGGDGYKMVTSCPIVYDSDKALFYTVGEYIEHISNNNKELDYPPVIEKITYDNFNFVSRPSITLKILYDNKIVSGEKFYYCFYTNNKVSNRIGDTTKEDGTIILQAPEGASVCGVWVRDRYIEVFVHSYFAVNAYPIILDF